MNARTGFTFSGLTPAQARFLRAEGLLEAAELELYRAQEEVTPDLRPAIEDQRFRLGMVATFAHLQGWPTSHESTLTSTQAQFIKLTAVLEANELPLSYALACVEAPGPDYCPELASYLRKLLEGLKRARERVDGAAWGHRS